jgi:hypothetical protein
MRATQLVKTILLASSIALAVVPLACKTAEVHDRASTTADSVVAVGGAAGQTQLHLDNTLAALEQIAATAKQDPLPAFKTFADSFDAFGRHLADLTEKRKSLETESMAWFTDFEKQNAAIQDPDLRKQGDQRLADFRTKVGGVSGQVDNLMAETLSLQGHLKDVRTFLGNDLTPAGIANVAGRITSYGKDGRKVAEGLGKLSKSSGDLAASLRSARAPAQ